ncbi:MAG: thioredoxin domain-containing protein [Candidatus Taylorbacteria bacterium]|nr:thioredoxin domain-containing protein [Candidatus Taylorbacteria bacterium]
MTHTTHKEEWLAMPIAVIIAGGLIALGLFYGLKSSGSPAQGDAVAQNPQQGLGEDFTGELAPVSASEHIRGNPKAKVVIVEYSDTECPFCKMYHNSMKEVMSKYESSGDVAWVYRHYPIDQLHKKARKEAEATECAAELGGNTKFWAYIDRLFEVTTSNDGLSESELPNIAQYVGLDRTAFTSCLSSGRTAAKVQAQFDGGAKAGVRGTPHSFIVTKDDKVALSGAVPFAELDKMIQNALSR